MVEIKDMSEKSMAALAVFVLMIGGTVLVVNLDVHPLVRGAIWWGVIGVPLLLLLAVDANRPRRRFEKLKNRDSTASSKPEKSPPLSIEELRDLAKKRPLTLAENLNLVLLTDQQKDDGGERQASNATPKRTSNVMGNELRNVLLFDGRLFWVDLDAWADGGEAVVEIIEDDASRRPVEESDNVSGMLLLDGRVVGDAPPSTPEEVARLKSLV